MLLSQIDHLTDGLCENTVLPIDCPGKLIFADQSFKNIVFPKGLLRKWVLPKRLQHLVQELPEKNQNLTLYCQKDDFWLRNAWKVSVFLRKG